MLLRNRTSSPKYIFSQGYILKSLYDILLIKILTFERFSMAYCFTTTNALFILLEDVFRINYGPIG